VTVLDPRFPEGLRVQIGAFSCTLQKSRNISRLNRRTSTRSAALRAGVSGLLGKTRAGEHRWKNGYVLFQLSIIGEHEAGRQLSGRVAPDAPKKAEGCFFKLKSSPTAA
jgi:hypothetical protein